MDPRIEEYIRANRRTYTREAIRQQLIDAGHDPAAIDATWEMLHAPDPDEAGVAGEGFWGRFLLILVGVNVVVFLLVGLGTGMLVNFAGYSVLLIVLAVALGIGALISWGIVAAVEPEKLGRTSATVIGAVVPALFALLIGGSCYALAGAVPAPAPPAATGVMELHIDEPTSFDGQGPVTCQPYSGEVGFSVFSESLGTMEGRVVTVSFESYGTPVGPEGVPAPAPAPGSTANVNLYISLQPRQETDMPRDYFVIPGTQVELDPASDAFSGTVSFQGLGSPPEAPDAGDGTAEDRISGTLTWTCDGVTP